MNNKGYTLTQALISATLVSVVVLGALQYYAMNRWDPEESLRTKLAWNNMANRMALAIELDYFVLEDSLQERSVPIRLNGYQAYRSTIVKHVDDPLDGVAPFDTTLPDYLEVIVKWAWSDSTNITDSLSCMISEERGWHY